MTDPITNEELGDLESESNADDGIEVTLDVNGLPKCMECKV